jgi:hypothetical protein
LSTKTLKPFSDPAAAKTARRGVVPKVVFSSFFLIREENAVTRVTDRVNTAEVHASQPLGA